MKLSQEDYDTIIAALEYSLDKAQGRHDEKEVKAIEQALSVIETIGTY